MNKFLTKSISAACVALMLSFSSCVGENHFERPDVMAVSLSVDMAQSGTRLASRPMAGEEVEFTSGDLYFTTADGVILQHFEIVASGAPALGPNRTVTGSEINRGDIVGHSIGVRFPEVPGDAAAVVVVGNTGLGDVSGNINSAGVIDILSQHNKENVNLFGRSPLSPPVSGLSTGNSVLLTPTVARIEIGSIRAMGQIRSFRVEGIFIDNVYRHARANGTVFPGSLVSSGSNWTMFNDNSTAIYATSTRGILFDWFVTGGGVPGSLTTSMTVTPRTYTPALPANFVWGYQVFASDTTLPRIVIRLRSVEVIDENGIGTYYDLQFVTVTHFEVGGTPISGMSGGHVYSIAITFDETDLRL